MPLRAALYARYSSDRQNERSIGDQLELGRRRATALAADVVAELQDAAISGAAMANRPGLLSLLALAEAAPRAIDLVIVEDLDRLARNLEHQVHVYNRLRDAGVQLATFAAESTGLIEAGLRGIMNELYIENLSAKTRRGMHANAEKGLATGSRTYGYRSAPGGAIDVVPEEKAVVIRIFQGYAGGLPVRDIALQLNREGVPGPRGGTWNASTIQGSRQRGNGILRTELYAGVKVWNRVEMRKDRATGKRISRPRPPADWRRTPVPELAILPAGLWDEVQARLEASRPDNPGQIRARHYGLFSGLLKCRCGASYVSRRGGRLECAAHREKGPAVCDNARTVSRTEVERRILQGLQERLLSPAAIAAYVRAYQRQRQAQARTLEDRRQPLERRLAELGRRKARVLETIETSDDRAVRAGAAARLGELEREADVVAGGLAEISNAVRAEPVVLHPNAGEAFARQVAQLQATLAARTGDDATPLDRRLVDQVRGLVQKIEILPTSAERAAPVELVLHGDLAAFLVAPGASTAPTPQWGRAVVAGGRYTQAPPCVAIRLSLKS